MKKIADIFMILVLLLAIGFVVFAAQGEGNPASIALAVVPSGTAIPVLQAPLVTPSAVPSPTLIPASVTVPTGTATLKPPPTNTPLPSPTSTNTLVPSPTATSDPTRSPVDDEINAGILIGNKIVKAIEAYHSAIGQYPASLDALLPDYMKTIPSTYTGRPYFYRLFDSSSPLASEVYWVAFKLDSRDHVTCTYMRRLDYWDCDYSSP